MFMMLRRIFWIGFVLGGKNGKDGRRKTEFGNQGRREPLDEKPNFGSLTINCGELGK